jgi:spore germination protein GerM
VCSSDLYVGGVVELDYVAKISSKNSTLCYDTVMVAIEEMESEYLLDFEINGKTNNPNYSMVKDREGNVIPNLLLLNQTERLMKEKAVDGVLTGEALKDSLVELSNKLNLNTKAIVGSLKDEAFTNSSHLQSYIEDKAVLDMMKIKESPAPSPALDNKLEKPNGFTIR